jgi:hypothetical protein
MDHKFPSLADTAGDVASELPNATSERYLPGASHSKHKYLEPNKLIP